MNKNLLIVGIAAAFSLTACKPHMDAGAPSAGVLDFSRYVAVGNSLTSGFADGTLYRSGQLSSYPSMLAKQFAIVGGGSFTQPLLHSEGGYPNPKRILGYSADSHGIVGLGPVLDKTNDTAGDGISIAAQGPYNNMGVPGIRAIDYLLPGYPSLNPYAKRFFSNLAATPVAEIGRIQATFFTAWIGNNDVLAYATSGGSGKSSGGSFLDQNSISSTSLFAAGVDSVVTKLTANGAKGALMNIPDVTAIPYFTTVPYNGLVLTRQGQVDSLNFAYKAAGITFTLGQNGFIIADPNAPAKLRMIKAGEYILLTIPQDSLKYSGWGSLKPIPGQYVLDATEVAAVKAATTTFNGIIQSEAAAHGLAYVDMNSFLKTLSSGILYNGVTFTTTFVSGNSFSLDGVHLTPRGYALAANEIIRTINAYYGSNVPQTDINSYDGIKFP